MEYLDSRIASANEAQLVALMYEGLIEKFNQAIAYINSNENSKLSESISKSRDIIAELLATLQGDSEVALNYKRLYMYLNELITKANITKDVAKLDEAISIVQPLFEGWTELGEQLFLQDVANGKSSPVMTGMSYGKGYLNDDMPSGGTVFEA